MASSVHAPLRGRWKSATGLSFAGTCQLLAVVSVLILVSLQRLRGFARHENEVDARTTVRLLSKELASWEPTTEGAAPPTIRDLVTSPTVERAVSDADFLAEGRYLRRHGYLFEVVPLRTRPATEVRTAETLAGEVQAAEIPLPAAIRAWPWRSGQTGRRVWLGTPEGGLFRHENDEGHWSGPGAELGDPAGWPGWDRLE